MQSWDPFQDTQHHKGLEGARDSHWPDCYSGSVSYIAENARLRHAWERWYLLEFGIGCPEMGELLFRFR